MEMRYVALGKMAVQPLLGGRRCNQRIKTVFAKLVGGQTDKLGPVVEKPECLPIRIGAQALDRTICTFKGLDDLHCSAPSVGDHYRAGS